MIDVIGGLALGAAMAATYALGRYHGRAYVSDRTFGPVAAGLVRIEAASEALEVALDEPVPYWPVGPFCTDCTPRRRNCHCA